MVVQHMPRPLSLRTQPNSLGDGSSGVHIIIWPQQKPALIGRQLFWCVVWGLFELVGWPVLIFHSGWRDACEPRWRVPGCWFDRTAGQHNAPVDPCSHVQLKSSAWQPMRRKLWWPHQWPYHRLSMFHMLFPLPLKHDTVSHPVKAWKMATVGTCSVPGPQLSCELPSILSSFPWQK